MNRSQVIRRKTKKIQTLYIWILEMHRKEGINRNTTHVATIGFHASSAKKTYNAEQKLLLWCLVNAGLSQHISVNTEQVGQEKSCFDVCGWYMSRWKRRRECTTFVSGGNFAVRIRLIFFPSLQDSTEIVDF